MTLTHCVQAASWAGMPERLSPCRLIRYRYSPFTRVPRTIPAMTNGSLAFLRSLKPSSIANRPLQKNTGSPREPHTAQKKRGFRPFCYRMVPSVIKIARRPLVSAQGPGPLNDLLLGPVGRVFQLAPLRTEIIGPCPENRLNAQWCRIPGIEHLRHHPVGKVFDSLRHPVADLLRLGQQPV